jgi:beta-galactosidase
MAGEVYPGWLTHWGDAAFQGTAVDIGEKLDAFMRERLSFNLYVIHGGTSFAFYAGANIDDRTGAYQPDITSYDYAAPINEQGAATPKYAKYREIIARYLPSPLPEVPPPLPTIERLGRAALMPAACATIWDNLPEALPAGDTIDPQPFEMYGQAFGFALYRTTLPTEAMQADSRLETGGVHDYATVFVDGEYVGGISRARMPAHSAKRYGVANETDAPLMLPATAGTQNATRQAQRSSTQLDILVEGMGRVNYGHAMVDRKGLLGPVTLRLANGTGETL